MRARLVAGLILAGALIAPSVAGATLVYQKGIGNPTVWTAADDATNPVKLGKGSLPRIAPDGLSVSFVANANSDHASLKEMPIAGGASKTLVGSWSYGLTVYSPDSRYLAALAAPKGARARERLVIVDRTDGAVHTVARGYFAGWSFSPDSSELVYGFSNSQDFYFERKANLLAAPSAGGPVRSITSDGRSVFPVWGPERIAYTRFAKPTGKHADQDGVKFNISTIKSDGSDKVAVTHDKVPFLLTGLSPTAWSLDGTRLLTQFGGQDTTYPVTVDPTTGAERIVGKRRQVLTATALSKDGSTVLAYNGFEGGASDVFTAPYAGGKPTVLVKNASSPDWNR